MRIQNLHKNYSEAIKQISENRSNLTESRRNELTIEVIERELRIFRKAYISESETRGAERISK